MSEPPAVDVLTFGCRLNGVESDAMQAQAFAAGWRDLTIVNTCAVTAEAARQARQAVRRLRRSQPDRRIVVTGCASETEGARFRAMPEIDAIVPNGLKADPATWRHPGQSTAPEDPAPGSTVQPAMHTRGFVEIQNGCDHRCTFCIIPFGRGASRSKPIDEITRQIAAHLDRGALEIVLTGVDVTAYGADVADRPSLGRLVQDLLRAFPHLPRLRLSSLDCVEIDADLLKAFASERRLMPHLHLSIQSGSDLILKRMKRRHRRADVIAFCQRLRALRPDIVFGADLITGFPTEDEGMFADTLSLVETCGITFVHAFPFSARPGTPAARMPPVDGKTIQDRALRLRSLGARQLDKHLQAHVGQRVTVLTERGGRGHTEGFAGVRFAAALPPGVLMAVTVTGQDGRLLLCAPED